MPLVAGAAPDAGPIGVTPERLGTEDGLDAEDSFDAALEQHGRRDHA
jgi:hypothetical protein